MSELRPFLGVAHIGDLHASDHDPGHVETLRAVVAQIGVVGDALSFVFVPGDNADNGLPAAYARVRAALAAPWPFVLVTSPADRRLAHDAAHVIAGAATVRALVLGPDVAACDVSADDGPWQPMRRAGPPGLWESRGPVAGTHIRVRAAAADASTDTDGVERATRSDDIPASKGIGSDRDALGAWEARGLLGTQLGPNRNGRTW